MTERPDHSAFRIAAAAILFGSVFLLLLAAFSAGARSTDDPAWRDLPGTCPQGDGLVERVFPKGGWSYARAIDAKGATAIYFDGRTTLQIDWRRNPNGGPRLCAWRWRVYEEI